MRTMIVVAALVFQGSVAKADWQYVRWGMTTAQVVAASKGELQPSSGDGGKRIMCIFNDQQEMAFAPGKKVGTFTFDLIVCGKSGKVASVSLRGSPQGTYNGLRSELLAKYGRPIEDGRGDMAITSWQDTKSRNLVRLNRFMEGGSIEYRAISPSGL